MLNLKNKKFNSVKLALSKVNKSIYRESLDFDSISLLEKAAISGKGGSSVEPRPKTRQKAPDNTLTSYLKTQHKNSTGVQIYDLPKLPFGLHQPYNDSENFSNEHFKKDLKPDKMSENLEMLTRKFRLLNKNKAKRQRGRFSSNKKHESISLYYFKMDSGYLICPKIREITKIYDKDRENYEKRSLQTPQSSFRRSPEHSIETSKKAQDNLTQRLCPSREKVESSLSKMYSSKYSALFVDTEETTRPVTSFPKRNFKSFQL
jgi:hypothetical protein